LPQDIRDAHPAAAIMPAFSFTLLSTGTVDPPTRAIYVAVSGTATWTDLEGNTEADIPLTVPSVLAVAITDIASISGATLYAMR